MRRSVRDQLSLVPAPFDHDHVRELAAMVSVRWTAPGATAFRASPRDTLRALSGRSDELVQLAN